MLAVQRRPAEGRQRGPFPCPQLAAGWRAELPARNSYSPASPGASRQLEGNKLVVLQERRCWSWWGSPRSPSAFTGLCCDPAVPGAAHRELSRRVCGSSSEGPWGVPWWGLALRCPRPCHGL